MNILEWEAGKWRIVVNYPKVESLMGECSMWACLRDTMSTNKIVDRDLKVTNVICVSVLSDMSTPDKKRVAESLDSWRNWRSASIYSCFLAWTGVRNAAWTRHD
jgi:hypothetical protein